MLKRLFGCLVLLTVAGGCASTRMSDTRADRLFRQERYDEAATHLEKGVKEQGENGRDLLLYLLDHGLSLHMAGKYEESNRAFEQAEKIADIKDYTSLAAEASTLLVTDNIKDYKGEDFEKVLINVYMAMNYAMLGAWDDALVEARKVNRKLYLMVTEGKRKYKQNAFARYFSAILYEAQGEYNDAFIDYKKTYELMPTYPGLGLDLWRCAWVLGMYDEDQGTERWRKAFNLTAADIERAKEMAPEIARARRPRPPRSMLIGQKKAAAQPEPEPKGELIVIFQNGISPIKKPHPSFHSVPKFYPRFNPVSHARVEVGGEVKGTTAVLHDVENTAIENLDEKYAGIVAKKVGGLVAKKIVADQVERATKDPLLGLIAFLVMHVTDQADLRSWNLLPKDLQISRIPLAPGSHKIRLVPYGSGPLQEKTIEIQAGRKAFAIYRYTP